MAISDIKRETQWLILTNLILYKNELAQNRLLHADAMNSFVIFFSLAEAFGDLNLSKLAIVRKGILSPSRRGKQSS